MTEDVRDDVLDERFPARRFLRLVGDKWTPVVLYCLSADGRRFSELQRRIPDISNKVLIQVLRRLEGDGLVDRSVRTVTRPTTEYRLTESGRLLHEPVALLCRWAAANTDLLDRVETERLKSRGDGRIGRGSD